MAFFMYPRQNSTNSNDDLLTAVAARTAVTVKNLGPQTAFVGKPNAGGSIPGDPTELDANNSTVVGAGTSKDFTMEIGDSLKVGYNSPGCELWVTTRSA